MIRRPNRWGRDLAFCLLAPLVGACGAGGEAGAESGGRPFPPPSPIGRCVNMGNALEAPNESDWGYTVRSEDLVRIREAGFDTVRVPIAWSAHTLTEPPYTIDRAFLARVDEVIDAALAADLTVIIDVHHYAALMDDPVAEAPRLDAIWDQIARHFADHDERLVFELVNEPHGALTASRTDTTNGRLLARIRQDNPDRWVIAGGAGWGSLDGLLESRLPDDPRLIATFHYYDPYEFTHQGASWAQNPPPMGRRWGSSRERRTVARDMDRAARFGVAEAMPVFMGEFGVIGRVPVEERAEWLQHVREQADAYGIGWCHWDWTTSFPLYDAAREDWIAPVRDALLPPRPQEASGE